MSLLAVRLLLAPALVVLASLAARRWGPRAAGVAAGIPIVAAPILLVLALDHGPRFGGGAARAALLGVAGSAAFALVYGHVAVRARWPWSLLAGWAAFFAVAAVVASVSVPAPVGLPVTLAAVALARLGLPRGHGPARLPGAGRPSWDLALRALSAAALVVAVTELAGALGPRATGALAPFPVAASVLCAFTHVQDGAAAVVALLRAMLFYFAAFAAFCFSLALALPALGTAAGFAVAVGALAATAAALAAWDRRAVPAAV